MPWLRDRATKTAFVRRSVSRFMPGEQIDDALRAAAELKPQGITTILTKLGENLTQRRRSGAGHAALSRRARSDRGVRPRRADLGQADAARPRSRSRALRAQPGSPHRAGRALDNFVWIDMESSPYVDPTLDAVPRGRARRRRASASRLQAYLYRTEKDVESLVPLGAGDPNRQRGVPRAARGRVSEEVGRRRELLQAVHAAAGADARKPGALLHIATHDIRAGRPAGGVHRATPGAGVRVRVRDAVRHSARPAGCGSRATGKRLRVLISYGEYWFPWYMRRLAERPANVWFVVRTMFG